MPASVPDASARATPPDPADEPLPIGRVLAGHRKENGWTLAQMSRRTGVSISALSKIENGQSLPAYDVMTRLAAGLDIDLAELLGGSKQPVFASGARAISRAGEGSTFRTDMGLYKVLATELASKSLTPMVIEVPPPTLSRPHVRSAHGGEEFVYVLEGEVVFTMGPYAPVVLSAGDSVYFDGSCDHGFHASGSETSRILSVVLSGRTPPSGKAPSAKAPAPVFNSPRSTD